jgi:chemotaxis protein MotB
MYDDSIDPLAYDTAVEEEDNWLVSYADLLTNLLAFFVLMFAISNIHNVRLEMLANTFSRGRGTAGVTQLKKNVDEFIDQQGLSDSLETVLDASGLEIRFRARMLFAQGSAALSTEGASLLEPIGTMLEQVGDAYFIVVEGHADDVPINTPEFASNWELSAQRSVNVVRQLIELGVAAERVSAQAFGDTRPMVRGETKDMSIEERRMNDRRVVVRVY